MSAVFIPVKKIVRVISAIARLVIGPIAAIIPCSFLLTNPLIIVFPGAASSTPINATGMLSSAVNVFI